MNDSISLMSKITAHYPKLSASAQNIANYLQQHPMAVVSYSVAELASKTNTSKASVSRFFRQLGYQSHQEAKQAMLAKRASGFPVGSEFTSTNTAINNEIDNLRRSLQAIPETNLHDVSLNIAQAKRVLLIAYRNSFPVALNFRQQLKQIRGSVDLFPHHAQTLAEDLVDLQSDEFVILIGFRRRPRIFKQLIKTLPKNQTLLICDPSGQIYNQDVSNLFVCHMGEEQALDSYASAMALVSILCNRVYQHLGKPAQKRAEEISSLYDSFNELS